MVQWADDVRQLCRGRDLGCLDDVFLVNDFESIHATPYSRSLFIFSVSNSWHAVFAVTYAIEFLCLSVAKLIVLDRMSDFAAGLWISKHWAAARRAVLALVVVGNPTGLAGNIAAAVPFHRVALLNMEASADYSADKTELGNQKIHFKNPVVQSNLPAQYSLCRRSAK
jgi:hypothetical protein